MMNVVDSIMSQGVKVGLAASPSLSLPAVRSRGRVHIEGRGARPGLDRRDTFLFVISYFVDGGTHQAERNKQLRTGGT